MKIKNTLPKWFPYLAITIGRTVFVKRGKKLNEKELRHEYIHLEQQKELWYVPFFLIYVVEFLIKFVVKLGRWNKAYRAISFEREAYRNEDNETYLRDRKRFAWIKYIL